MRILCVLPSLGRGGAERVALALGEAWADRHDVHLVVLQPVTPALSTDLPVTLLDDRPAYGLRGRLRALPRRLGRLRRLLREARPDCILSFLEGANLPTALAAAATAQRARLIVSVRTDFRAHRVSVRAAMRLLYPGLRVVAPSTELLRLLHAKRIAHPDRSVMLPNPLLEPRAPAPLPPDLPRHYLLAVGRLAPEKDFALLLHAYARAARTRSLPPLVIAGEGPERPALRALAQRLDLTDRLHLPGYLEDTPRLFGAAAAFVLTSKREGWPQVLVQALAAGCPAIALDCPTGPREILDEGRAGLLVDQRTPEALAAAVTRLLGDPTLTARLRAAGPAAVAAYRLPHVARLWLRALEACAAGEAIGAPPYSGAETSS